MIDLHMHSTHSDGTDSVTQMLKKAEKKNLTCISITDHNTCSAYQELNNIDIKKYYTGKIITGIELNTSALGIPIEILGYGVDPNIIQKNIKGMYLTYKERNILEVKRLYNKCIKSGIKLERDFVKNYSPEQYVSKYLHKILTKDKNNKKLISQDAWEDSLVLYRKYMSDPESPFFVDMMDVLPNLEKVIKLVRNANGKIFIPHIFEYKHNSINILEYILNNYKIDGIECYYSNFTDNQTEELLDLCQKKSLLVSGGSDYHGLNEPDIDMGYGKGKLAIDEAIIENWKEISIYYDGNESEKVR